MAFFFWSIITATVLERGNGMGYRRYLPFKRILTILESRGAGKTFVI